MRTTSRRRGKEVSKAWVPKRASHDLLEMTRTYRGETGGGLSEFGLLMRALGIFMDKFDGEVPLAGGIPDMVSSTDMYTKLQGIFEAKAASDKRAFADIVATEAATCGYPRHVEPSTIDLFCKHVFDVKAHLCAPWRRFLQPNVDEISWYDEGPDKEQTPIMWYLALRAVDRFQEANGYFPGAIDGDGAGSNTSTLDQDADAVHALLQALVAELKLPVENFSDDALSRKHALEITRYGAIEMHNTAAVIGGLAAQEAVKLARTPVHASQQHVHLQRYSVLWGRLLAVSGGWVYRGRFKSPNSHNCFFMSKIVPYFDVSSLLSLSSFPFG